MSTYGKPTHLKHYSPLKELHRWYNEWAKKNNRPSVKSNTMYKRLMRRVSHKRHNNTTFFHTATARIALVTQTPEKAKCFGILMQYTPRPEAHSTVSDLLPEVNKMREHAGFPPYKRALSLLPHLKKHKCPYIEQTIAHINVRFWHKETALRILYNVNPRCVFGKNYENSPHALYATLPEDKLNSKIYAPVHVVAKLLHSPYNRLSRACTKLLIPCYRHPVTNERVCNVNEAYEYLAYRSAQYIKRKMGFKAFEIIRASCPRKYAGKHPLYYCPELIEEE